MITADDVKKLRDITGVSVMQCRKALEEAEGDFAQAKKILERNQGAAAAKKADRMTKDGLVVVVEKDGKALGVELLCETDFVARNEDFVKGATDIANKGLESGVDEAKKYAEEVIPSLIQKIGENIQLGDVIEVSADHVGVYVHGGKKASIIGLKGGSKELAKDIAMHATAMGPRYIRKEDISDEDRTDMMKVFEKEVAESGRPDDIKAKMLEGKMNTHFASLTLVEQDFIKDPSKTVKKLLEEKSADVVSYTYLSVGL